MSELRKVGAFPLLSPTLQVADPNRSSYGERFALLENCVVGDWTGYIHVVTKEDLLDNPRLNPYGLHRNSHLAVFADSFCGEKEDVLKKRVYAKDGWHKSKEYVEVESGQAGFFEAKKFQNESEIPFTIPKHHCPTLWESVCSDATLNKKHAGAIHSGIVSISGIGDGYYDLWYHTNKSGQIDGAFLRFLPFRKSFELTTQ